jgi:hypothetical protein
MIVTLICEPRTGSNNLMRWFKTNKSFDVLLLPSWKNSVNFQKGLTPKNYKFNNENLFIKEEFHSKYKDFTELIEVSDYVIYLYRENFKEQVESWVNAKKYNNFNRTWVFEKDKCVVSDDDIRHFQILKKDFKEIYLDDVNNFKISYEELYFNNGIEKIIIFLNKIKLNITNFPIGEKYRVERAKRL